MVAVLCLQELSPVFAAATVTEVWLLSQQQMQPRLPGWQHFAAPVSSGKVWLSLFGRWWLLLFGSEWLVHNIPLLGGGFANTSSGIVLPFGARMLARRTKMTCLRALDCTGTTGR